MYITELKNYDACILNCLLNLIDMHEHLGFFYVLTLLIQGVFSFS